MKQITDAKPSGARKTYHHGDLRKVLLDAALAEVAAHGAQGLSMASLARRAGVAQSAPYRHFSDREDLLAAVATDGFERFTEALLEAASDGDDVTALNRMAVAYLVFGERNVELYRLMFASGLVPGAAPDSALKRAANTSFQPLLDRVRTSDPAASPLSAHVRWGQLHGLVMLKADGFIHDPLEALVGVLSL
ncbi:MULTISPECIES: TetR/AcrR family transcriptional regulator [Gluconobacter]|uniref:TetR/AcrR family transcriptional regulator n=1 Tax=Gluconobacter cadivus TaxID=2728101 RepID=A0ABR9YWD4_9PROT|nr:MULTISPECIES: TetR/AcrR family transcriptional regulator [Gluconobacter]MBF0888818.1 TetR/AcrR family transcriptional regulator [Gluconobacter cadivus]MBS1059828.1 TetR/AcrR family transcriptional regulator [Gluconobacter sp. Dm-44]